MGNLFRKYERLQLKKKGFLKYRGRSENGVSIMEQARKARDGKSTTTKSVKANKPKTLNMRSKKV